MNKEETKVHNDSSFLFSTKKYNTYEETGAHLDYRVDERVQGCEQEFLTQHEPMYVVNGKLRGPRRIHKEEDVLGVSQHILPHPLLHLSASYTSSNNF